MFALLLLALLASLVVVLLVTNPDEEQLVGWLQQRRQQQQSSSMIGWVVSLFDSEQAAMPKFHLKDYGVFSVTVFLSDMGEFQPSNGIVFGCFGGFRVVHLNTEPLLWRFSLSVFKHESMGRWGLLHKEVVHQQAPRDMPQVVNVSEAETSIRKLLQANQSAEAARLYTTMFNSLDGTTRKVPFVTRMVGVVHGYALRVGQSSKPLWFVMDQLTDLLIERGEFPEAASNEAQTAVMLCRFGCKQAAMSKYRRAGEMVHTHVQSSSSQPLTRLVSQVLEYWSSCACLMLADCDHAQRREFGEALLLFQQMSAVLDQYSRNPSRDALAGARGLSVDGMLVLLKIAHGDVVNARQLYNRMCETDAVIARWVMPHHVLGTPHDVAAAFGNFAMVSRVLIAAEEFNEGAVQDVATEFDRRKTLEPWQVSLLLAIKHGTSNLQ